MTHDEVTQPFREEHCADYWEGFLAGMTALHYEPGNRIVFFEEVCKRLDALRQSDEEPGNRSGRAEFIRKLDGWIGDARLYSVAPPVAYGDCLWDDDAERTTTEYVIVSAVVVSSGAETLIFPATAEGEPIEMGELPGSYRGGLDHAQALTDAGYTPAERSRP